jgi:small subunit ribosomal protein S14
MIHGQLDRAPQLCVKGPSLSKDFEDMAKTSSVLKNERRKALVAKYSARRKELKAIIKNPATSAEDRAAAQLKLGKLPRDSNPVRVTLRCAVTGRPRGNLRKFGLSRMQFRDKALKGELTGVVKASW